jgi:hypothetical protein
VVPIWANFRVLDIKYWPLGKYIRHGPVYGAPADDGQELIAFCMAVVSSFAKLPFAPNVRTSINGGFFTWVTQLIVVTAEIQVSNITTMNTAEKALRITE